MVKEYTIALGFSKSIYVTLPEVLLEVTIASSGLPIESLLSLEHELSDKVKTAQEINKFFISMILKFKSFTRKQIFWF